MFFTSSSKPNALLNHVMQRLGASTDAHLGRLLGIHGSGLGHIRTKRHGISDKLIVAILYAIPDMTLADLQELGGLSTED
jgi:hypothetical protein